MAPNPTDDRPIIPPSVGPNIPQEPIRPFRPPLSWTLGGNNSIEPATDYLGTNDAQPVIIKTNARESMRITPQGNVSIGTSDGRAGLTIDKGSTNDLALLLRSSGAGWGSGVQFSNKQQTFGIYCGGDAKLHVSDEKQRVDRLVIDGKGNIDVTGDVGLNDKTVLLRGTGDKNHGLGWFGSGKLYAGSNVDGPVVFGCSGGALGTTSGDQRVALSWNTDGNIGIGTGTIPSPSPVAGGIPPEGRGIWIQKAEAWPHVANQLAIFVNDGSQGGASVQAYSVNPIMPQEGDLRAGA